MLLINVKMLNLKNYYYNKKREKKHDRKSMREKAW